MGKLLYSGITKKKHSKKIDLLEEENGEFSVYEFKYSLRKEAKLPADFSKHYRVKSFSVINSENWHKYF